MTTAWRRAEPLFVHVPRWEGDRRQVMVLPLGLPALANLLADHGRHPAIAHVGIERETNPRFSFRDLAARTRPRLIFLTLHWALQTRGVIDTARRLRRWLPQSTIVVGGLTASAFARELIEQVGSVDAVVRGDGEAAVLALARVVLDGDGSFHDVPNLVWRDGATLRDQGMQWSLDEDTAAQLRHGSLERLRNRRAYVGRVLYADFSEGATDATGYPHASFLNAGRGCEGSCVGCGGAAESQLMTCGRKGLLLYSIDKLVRDVREAIDEGSLTLRSSFDSPSARDHVIRWFGAIRDEGQSLRLIYDCWPLPSDALLQAAQDTFASDSMMVLSPECGSEQVRARVRAFPFGNDQLVEALRRAEGRGLRTHCFFSAGLPTETPLDVDETVRLIERIRRETQTTISVYPMVVDPASTVFRDPQRFGVKLTRRTLRDFYEEKGLPGGPGYESDAFDERAILRACDRLLRAAGLPAAYAPRA